MTRRHIAAAIIGYLAAFAACTLGIAWLIWQAWKP